MPWGVSFHGDYNMAAKNIPTFEWIDDAETREHCENHFVNDETIDLLREGNILREYNGNILVYSLEHGRYLLHDPIGG